MIGILILTIRNQDSVRTLHTVSRVWEFMRVRRHSGMNLGLDEEFPYRGCNPLTIRCPACPEVGVNMAADGVLASRDQLPHTCQRRITTDGNFQLNMFRKRNSTTNDSLWGGDGYSPSQSELEAMLNRDPDSSEVSCMSHPV